MTDAVSVPPQHTQDAQVTWPEMLHPVGSLPPSVYWRRRVTLIGVLVVLVIISVYVLRPGGGNGGSRAAAETNTLSPTPTPTQHTDAVARDTTADTTAAQSTTSATTSPAPHSSASSSAAPQPCQVSALKIAAVVGKASYNVGDNPVLMMQVTNPGKVACVQDLADSQVELRVYNGESRVWGSHDCQVQPGTSPVTLMAGQSVRVSITWSGLSSQPQCAGTRQRVGAGSYTLYALLAGREGTAATFSLN